MALPIDIIGKFAQYCHIDDITSFLLTTSQQSQLMTSSELKKNLATIYNYPYTNSFKQLIRYGSYTPEMFCDLASSTDDLQLFLAHYSTDINDLIDLKIPFKYGSINIVNYLNPRKPFPDVAIKESIIYNQYYLVEWLAKKRHLSQGVYKYINNIRMAKIIFKNLPIRDAVEIIGAYNNYVSRKYWDILILMLTYIDKIKFDCHIDDLVRHNYDKGIDEILLNIINLLLNKGAIIQENDITVIINRDKHSFIEKILLNHHFCNTNNISILKFIIEQYLSRFKNTNYLSNTIDIMLDKGVIDSTIILMLIVKNKLFLLPKILSHSNCNIKNDKHILRMVIENNLNDVLYQLLLYKHYSYGTVAIKAHKIGNFECLDYLVTIRYSIPDSTFIDPRINL